ATGRLERSQPSGIDRDDRKAGGEAHKLPAGASGAARPEIYPFIQGDLLRIGREADNDIILKSKTVHRYHAVIRRSRDAGYVLIDLSGEGGNGVYVNGHRIHDAQLQDGDEFTLGKARLKFIIEH
ncbi:MAG: FHA domain-containing protein, partial [Pseudomonadota bacterium]